MLDLLAELKQQAVIGEAEYYFAKLVADKQQAYDYPQDIANLALLAAALCYHANRQGHSCLFLDENLADNFFGLAYHHSANDYLARIRHKIGHRPPTQWTDALSGHMAFSADPAQPAPLIFQFGALYLYRWWQDEGKLVSYLKSAVEKSDIFSADHALIRQILDRLFPHQNEETDWQKIAVATALTQAFCLISGGPGTGKTTTVFKLLAALQLLAQHQGLPPLRIQLVAPTGKAAARLSESLGRTLAQTLPQQPQLQALIPTQAQTIHRLLGVRPFDEQTRYHSHNPLPLDVLVVDEASMVDLSLMGKLLDALPPSAKLILLGDKDQLSSVEAGAVLGELGQFLSQIEQRGFRSPLAAYIEAVCGEALPQAAELNPICDSLCHLRKSYRFHEASGIGHLAKAVNANQDKHSFNLFREYADIQFKPYTGENGENVAQIVKSAVDFYQEYLSRLQTFNGEIAEHDVAAVFSLFNRCRFLSALRGGEFGVENLNLRIALALRQQGLVQFAHSRDWYPGKPVMVTENDSRAGVYNGDIGIFLPTGNGQGRVWFEQADHQWRSLPPSRVPAYESAFVMTVHKSQGSEFAHTALVLPAEFSPILSKELIYTAVTRAKSQLTVFGSEGVWKAAVRNSTLRQSGLGIWLERELK